MFRGQREAKLQELAWVALKVTEEAGMLADCILCKAYLDFLTTWPNAPGSVTCIEGLNIPAVGARPMSCQLLAL